MDELPLPPGQEIILRQSRADAVAAPETRSIAAVADDLQTLGLGTKLPTLYKSRKTETRAEAWKDKMGRLAIEHQVVERGHGCIGSV